MIRKAIISVLLILAALHATQLTGLAAQGEIEFFAPARLALSAIQAARHVQAAELAPDDLRLADQYAEEARAALEPTSGPSDVRKATYLFRLAAAQARLAETRAIEVASDRKAAGAADRFLEALDGPSVGHPAGPSQTPAAMTEYVRLRREAAQARAARRAAEEAVEQLTSDGS